jgi:hypothetical protein
MGIVNNQSVFIGPPLDEGDSRTATNFRDDDDFSVDLFDESIVLPSFPNNVGVALVNSSDSPADYATIALQGTNTSTIYIDNTAGSANLDISGDLNVRGASKFNVENAASLTQNSTFTFQLVNDTSLQIIVRGSDGVTRYGSIILNSSPIP